MPVLSLACHLPHITPHIPSRYNNEQTTKQTKAINNSYIYKNISCKCDRNRAGHFTLDAYASRPVACQRILTNTLISLHWGREKTRRHVHDIFWYKNCCILIGILPKFALHEENSLLQIRGGFLAWVIEMWPLHVPDLGRWVNSFSVWQKLLTKTNWSFLVFLLFFQKHWWVVLNNIITYIIIKICHCIARKTHFVL